MPNTEHWVALESVLHLFAFSKEEEDVHGRDDFNARKVMKSSKIVHWDIHTQK